MDILIDDVKDFIKKKVKPSAEYFDKNNIYPTELIEIMKSMGLFGLTIPKMYDSLEFDFLTYLQVTQELAGGWISLCAILDSHSRVCNYIVNYGTDKQKQKYLPLLAKGQLIAAHANTEKNMKQMEYFDTCIENVEDSSKTWKLIGRKEWITNARNADIFGVLARVVPHKYSDLKCQSSCVVLVEKNASGLLVGNEWNRMGVKGVSLAPVIFENCLVDTKNIIGEFLYDGKELTESPTRNLLLIASARSIGISKSLIEKCGEYLVTRKRNGIVGGLTEEPVVCMRFGELITKFEAANSLFSKCCSKINLESQSNLLACKIFTTDTVREIALICLQLFGGSGYTSTYDIERCIRDTLSITVIYPPSDALLTRIGKILFNDLKVKKEHSQGTILHYSPYVLPDIKHEYLLRVTLEEQEKIFNIGYYNNTNIQLFLYDMTTQNPSGTFKDFLGCITFAYCLQNNINCICAQSSGNTAMSFIHYARKNPAITLIQFYLTQNSFKIDPTIIPGNVLLIEVNGTEPEMKHLLKRFSELTHIPIMPNLQIQIYANKIRAHFIHDIHLKEGIDFNWYVQSISSAYGPIGLYQGFTDIRQQQPQLVPPKFLGVQQKAVCPFVRALGYLDNEIIETEIIEPTLFRSDPGPLISQVKNILDTYGGKLKVLTNNDFKKYLNQAVELLAKNNIRITKTDNNNIFEKSGIIAIAATLHEIDSVDYGVISPNDNVLIAITGGTRLPSKEKLKPKLVLNEYSTDEQLKYIIQFP